MIEYVFVVVIIVMAILAMTVINREPKTDPTEQILKKGRQNKGKSKKQQSPDSPTPTSSVADKKKKKNDVSGKKQKKDSIEVEKKKPATKIATTPASPPTPVVEKKEKKKTTEKVKDVKKKEQEKKEPQQQQQQPSKQTKKKEQEKKEPQQQQQQPSKQTKKKEQEKSTKEVIPAASTEVPTAAKKKKNKKKSSANVVTEKLIVDDGFSVVGKKKEMSKTPVTPTEDTKAKNDLAEPKQGSSASTSAPDMRSVVVTSRSAGISARNPNFIENPYKTEAEFWASASVVVAPRKKNTSAQKEKQQDSSREDTDQDDETLDQETEQTGRDAQKMAEQILGRESKNVSSKTADAPSVKVFHGIETTKLNPWSSIGNDNAPVETEFLGTPTEEYFPKLGEAPKKAPSQRKGKAPQSVETNQQQTEDYEQEKNDKVETEEGSVKKENPSTASAPSGHKRESDMVFEFENQAPEEKRPKRDSQEVDHQVFNGTVDENEETAAAAAEAVVVDEE